MASVSTQLTSFLRSTVCMCVVGRALTRGAHLVWLLVSEAEVTWIQ